MLVDGPVRDPVTSIVPEGMERYQIGSSVILELKEFPDLIKYMQPIDYALNKDD